MADISTPMQGALSFAYPWEIPPAADRPPLRSDPHADLGRTEQRLSALTVGLSQVADSIRQAQKLAEASAASLARLEAAVMRRSMLDDELRRHRDQELRTEILGPLFLGVIGALDRIAEEAPWIRRFDAQLSDELDGLAREALAWVGNARQVDKTEFRNVLTQFGIEWFRTDRGEPFDPVRHKAVAYEDTNRSELRGRVAQHRLHGYARRCDSWLIRPEIVVVFKVVS